MHPDKFLIGNLAYRTRWEPSNITLRKLNFYKKNKVKVKFNLAFKSHYEISGEIIESSETKYFKNEEGNKENYITDYCIIRNNGNDIKIFLDEIDPDTIFPIDFNPVKFYERIQISDVQRERIYKRDGYTCRYFFEGCYKNKDLQIDHIIPVSLGGLNVDENLVTCCSNCNLKKGNKVLYPNETRNPNNLQVE